MKDTILSQDDSLHTLVGELVASQDNQLTRFDSLSSRIDSIIELGVGYHNAVEHVALPLMIALFAFSLAFLFPTINHINNKYKSPGLARLFSCSCEYRMFWFSTILDIVVLLGYGFLTLLSSGELHHKAMQLSWMLLIVATVYAISIVCFVLYCISFNKPEFLLRMISKEEKRYLKSNSSKAARQTILNYAYLITDKEIKKNEKNEIKSNLPEFFHYVLNSSDMRLFDSVINEIDRIIHDEKKYYSSDYPYFSSLIIDYLFAIYAPLHNNLYIEDKLVRLNLKKYNYRSLITEKNIIAPLLKMAEYDHTALLDKYLEMSNDSFNNKKSLLHSICVQQGMIDNDFDKKCCDTLEQIQCLHFLMTAYWFSLGYYSFFNVMINRILQPFGGLYPVCYNEILSYYLRCKRKFFMYGDRFYVYDTVDRVGKVIDKRMLNRYTAALLLVTNRQTRNTFASFSKAMQKEFEQELENETDSLKSYLDELKEDEKFVRLYPYVKNADSKDVVDKCVQDIEDCRNSVFFNASMEGARQAMQQYYRNNDVVSIVKPNSYKELFADEIETNKDMIPFGEVYLSVQKWDLCSDKVPSIFAYREMEELISYRALYLALSAYNSMKKQEIKTTEKELQNCLKKIHNGNPDAFVSINCDSCLYYPHPNNRIIINIPGHKLMTESELFDKMRGGMLVVAKKDRVTIVSDGNEPEITVEDLSSQEEGTLNCRVTINPHLKLNYNKNATIYSIVGKKGK